MNKKLIKAIGGLILGIFFIPLINGCSSAIDIQSLSNDKQIVVDGNQKDWGSLSFIKNENIGFGFRNDKDNLYLCIVTSDRMKIRKILSGLTVWLKTDKDEIGIKFPMKPEGDIIPDMKNFSNDEGMRPPEVDAQDGENNQQRQRREERFQFLISRLNDLQIITPDNLPLYTNKADEGPDFIGKLGYQNEQLVYELKIPLVNNDITKRIFDNSVDEVNINFQTDKIEMPSGNFKGRREGNGGMEPPEGGGGFSGGPGGDEGGYGGGRRGGGEREGRQGRGGMGKMDFDALDYNFDVKLSK